MQNTKSNKGGVTAWFVENHVAANILMMLFIIGGILSISGMRTETFPTINPKLITISVPYPGATPYEVATSITKRAEEALIGVEGVKRISSKASEGRGTIKVELKDFANQDDVYTDIETIINSLSNFPPENAERPVINKVRVTPNVMTIAVYGNVEEASLKYWSEMIEDELRQLPNVSLTSISGVRKNQVSIEISEFALRKYGLTLENVNQAIKSHSRDIPAGAIESNQGEILLRIQDKKYNGSELEKVIIKNLQSGSVVTIGDVGKVIDGLEDINLVSKFNGEKAAFILVKRSENDDTLKIAKTIKEYLAQVKLPKGLKISISRDETTVLKDSSSNAVMKGVNAVIAPVTIGVMTTMAAFAPLIFSTGTLGQIISIIPVVVISILFISLIEAYFILPSHLSNPKLWSKGIIAKVRDNITLKLEDFVESIFIPFVKKSSKI